MSLLERNQDCMSLMEKIVSHVAADIHYGGGPRLQEIADELADKYPLVNAAPQLREALRQIAEAESVCCPRCEGDGRLWADGKAHYPSEQRDTILCGNCGGSGYLQPENAKDIAATTIAAAEV